MISALPGGRPPPLRTTRTPFSISTSWPGPAGRFAAAVVEAVGDASRPGGPAGCGELAGASGRSIEATAMGSPPWPSSMIRLNTNRPTASAPIPPSATAPHGTSHARRGSSRSRPRGLFRSSPSILVLSRASTRPTAGPASRIKSPAPHCHAGRRASRVPNGRSRDSGSEISQLAAFLGSSVTWKADAFFWPRRISRAAFSCLSLAVSGGT